MAPIVTKHSACAIVPSVPSSPGLSYHLSNIDIVLAGTHLSNVIFYFHSSSYAVPHDPARYVSKLQESLSETLSLLPIIAGRVLPDKNGRLQVSCNDQGVPFTEAYADTSLMDWNITDSEIEDLLVSQDIQITHLEETPILKLQVTMFKCGSWSMGMTGSEYLFDGVTLASFLRCWSETHCGLPISQMPLIDAKLLKARDPPHPSTLPARDYKCIHVDDHAVDCKSFARRQFSFSSTSVEDLIREIESGPHQYGRATSFQALTALVWKAVTEARNLPDDAETTYVYPVGLRNNGARWQPVIPSNYFGNAVHMSCVRARAGDIKSNHISYAASLIRNNNTSINVDYMKKVVDWMEIQLSNKSNHGFDSNLDRYGGRDVYATVWGFPFFNLSFGSGCRLVHLSLAASNIFGDGVSFMMPSPEGGKSKIITLSLSHKVMEQLVRSQLFNKYSTPPKVSLHSEEEHVVAEKPKWQKTLKFYSRL